MKKLLIAFFAIVMAAPAFAQRYEIQLATNKTIQVAAPPGWILQQKNYIENRQAEFNVIPSDESFLLRMFFNRIDGASVSREDVKARLVLDGQPFLEGAEENTVSIKELNFSNGYGFYATFTYPDKAGNPNPNPGEYKCMTRGFIRISDDIIMGFWLSSRSTDDLVFKDVLKYLTSSII